MLTKYIETFIADVCAGKTNETPIAYRSKLKHLENYLGEQNSFSQDDIDAFRRWLLERDTKRRGGKEIKGKLSKFTVRSILSTTRHFLRWAAEKGKIPQGIELVNIREPAADPKAVDQLTVEKLLKAAEETGEDWERVRNTALIYTLRDTGCRAGCLAQLDIDSLDLENGIATAPDKGDQLNWLWFNPPTVEAIREWLRWRDQLQPKDYRLFTGAKGYGLTRQGISRVLSRLAAAAGVTGRHNPHAFRHAFARDAILAGADLGQVSQMMNHRGIVVTDKYYGRWKKKELKKFHGRFSPGRNLPLPGQGSAKP